MSIEYKINVLAELKEKGYNTTRLRNEKLISESAIHRLRHNKSVSYEILSKLCNLLECDIGDILEFSDFGKVANYDVIRLKLPKGKKSVIRYNALKRDESIDEFINRIIDEAMERDKGKDK